MHGPADGPVVVGLVAGPEPVVGGRLGEPPQPVEEAAAALDDLVGLLRPVEVVGRRPDEEVEQPQAVGADGLVVPLGRDEVALRLRHLRPVHPDHALGEQPVERLARHAGGEPDVDEGPGVEAGVEQVEDGVLDAADVLVDRHPVAGGRRVERDVRAERVAEAEEVPRRVDERVHRVGLALGRPAVDRAGRVEEALVARRAATGRSART